ncbi:MAG: hypothetical protein LBH96_00575, partial [Candidatus Peribacteria bacterium]|nr:hypothetical protein [Candidatus Peribacteria bacterium]
MKYIIKILSILFSSLGLFAVVVAQSEEVVLEITNLPLLQEPNKTFTFDIALSTQYQGDQQQATLVVDDCGNDVALNYQEKIRMSIPLTLSPKGKQEFPITLYRDSNEECVLTFTLLGEENEVLTTTQVGVLPKCQNTRTSIDEGLDYNLPEILAQSSPSSTPTSQLSTSPQPSRQTQPTSPASNTSLLHRNNAELTAAFDTLIAEGLLTTGDKARLSQPLTRIEAAKLFVNIAIANELPRDTTKTCEFMDMENASTEDIAITWLACQFNIMGVHPDYSALDDFMPSLTITSEQLVTAFSRLMWRDLYETPDNEETYYQLHL